MDEESDAINPCQPGSRRCNTDTLQVVSQQSAAKWISIGSWQRRKERWSLWKSSRICVSSIWPSVPQRAVCQHWLEEWTGGEKAGFKQPPSVCVCVCVFTISGEEQPNAQKGCECLNRAYLNRVQILISHSLNNAAVISIYKFNL